MYETNTTFNINSLCFPLSIIIGIDNTNSTFPIALMYITLKLAKAFGFAYKQLINLVFYDYLEAAIIYGDFSKGLGAAIWKKAQEEELLELVSTPALPPSALDNDTIIV